MRRNREAVPSAALIISVIALVAALAGSALALPGRGSVESNDLARNAVKTRAIKNAAVKTPKLADGSVTAAKLAPGAAPGIADGSVTRAKQAPDQRTDWAVVNSDGSIAAQSGGIEVVQHGSGNFHLRFPVDLGQRPVAATLHGQGGAIGEISATRCGTAPGGAPCSVSDDSRTVFVKTANSSGAGTAQKFIVTVLPL